MSIKPKALWISWSFITGEPWHKSLEAYLGHESPIHWYDRSYPCDRGCLDAADRERPDVIIYTGMAAWEKTPTIDTFRRLGKTAPIIHISGDLSDPPYIPYLEVYNEAKCFWRSVNIDGNDEWPKGPNDITTLSPIAPQFFTGAKPIAERPINFGFAGGYSSPSRQEIINPLVAHAGLVLKPYDHRYGTYQAYADFLMKCKIVLNIPFSGSDAVRQVKGRVLESALAGCCLLDHAESKARKWFRLPIEFISYETPEQAAEIVRILATDPITMQWTSDNLRRRVLTEHSPDVFWPRVFQGL